MDIGKDDFDVFTFLMVQNEITNKELMQTSHQTYAKMMTGEMPKQTNNGINQE